MRLSQLSWITTKPCRAWVGSVSNKHNPSMKSGIDACISSRITTVIHVASNHQINDNCFNETFAVSPYRSLYWDMHGLIFETSIWLLAGSTRFLQDWRRADMETDTVGSTQARLLAVMSVLQSHWTCKICRSKLLQIQSEICPQNSSIATRREWHET
jgi:hypothetical protein